MDNFYRKFALFSEDDFLFFVSRQPTFITMSHSERPKLQLEQLKDVVLVLNNVTEWYRLGLQLDLPVHMLDSIKAHRLPVQNSMLDMVHRWLSYDPEASWEKLAKALDAIAERVVAESIRRQFLGAVAAAAQNLDDEPETRKYSLYLSNSRVCTDRVITVVYTILFMPVATRNRISALI